MALCISTVPNWANNGTSGLLFTFISIKVIIVHMDLIISHNIGKRYLITVDWKHKVFCQPTIVIRVKMSEEIRCAAFNFSILEGINSKTSSYSKKGIEDSQ